MKTVIKIQGMSCAGCRAGVENALKRVPGVLAVEVSLERAEAAVEHDEKKAAPVDLRAAVEKAGFKAV
ncbi:MAG: heavy-metal-associated domain-containing protein [Elusimicrobiales bacterium]|nr:heavy-metal-associated domain-containing protein [Elusimicrobiales bacterium]